MPKTARLKSIPDSRYRLELAEAEREILTRALEETRGVVAHTADVLGVHTRTLWGRIEHLGLDPSAYRYTRTKMRTQ